MGGLHGRSHMASVPSQGSQPIQLGKEAAGGHLVLEDPQSPWSLGGPAGSAP